MESKRARLTFDGYRMPIDDYYSGAMRGESVTLPKQKLPPRLAEAVPFLGDSTRGGRSEQASFLLDFSGSYRNTIARTIDQQLAEHGTLGRTKPMSTYGEHAFTLFT